MTAEVSSWKSIFLRNQISGKQYTYLDITICQNSPLDFSFKQALQKASTKKKKYANISLKDKTDDLAWEALWEKAGAQGEGLDAAELHLASAGSESHQTVPWDKDAICMNNWTVLWNTET